MRIHELNQIIAEFVQFSQKLHKFQNNEWKGFSQS